jgi:hypothetical protein
VLGLESRSGDPTTGGRLSGLCPVDGLNDNGLAAIHKGMNSAFRLSPFALFAPLCAVYCIPSASSGNAALDNGLFRTYIGGVKTPGVPEAIQELVERFTRNREEYVSGKYNETQLRREFLDPFFEALVATSPTHRTALRPISTPTPNAAARQLNQVSHQNNHCVLCVMPLLTSGTNVANISGTNQ